MSTARSPLVLAEQSARDAVDRHWAVKALPVATRRRARVAADRAWDALRAPGGAEPMARRATKGELLEIGTVAEAYERAAHEARQAILAQHGNEPGVAGAGDAREGSELREARVMLRVAAAECFRLMRVLPLDPPGTPAWQAVRVAALGVLGDVGAELHAWGELVARVAPAPPLPELVLLHAEERRWDEALRHVLPPIWMALLLAAPGDAIEAPFEALGRLRELRGDAEARLVTSLSANDAAHAQLALAGLYGVAEGAATLVAHLRRTMLADAVVARLSTAFTTARAGIGTTTPLGRTLPWLQLAAVQIARRQSVQIALPGLLG